ncbi:ferredoxin reductase family protein [Yoonia sp.]|uniref:ferredoxin reductase family protein n=1 Tax=Yoonia sp. TaxID=2212373 RepID=UPI001A0B9E55|nr:ferredoxin reductase family protein [Yoonia sp.]MBE0413850.1 ferredoxin reductase family protein [Yoonia sp.]
MRLLGLITIYGVLLVLPLVLSAVFGGPPRGIWAEIGSGLGMVAFAVILVEFVLSGRFKTVSNQIGMDVTMRVHQAMGRAALGLALVHPFFYGGSPSGGARPWDATRQLTLSTDMMGVGAGVAAYVLLPSFVIFAIYRKQTPQTYERWRLLHGLGAALIAGLLLVHTMIAGRYAAQMPVAWYWYAMTAGAVATLVHVYLLAPLKARKRAWRVQSVTPAAARQWALTLAPDGHDGLDYKAGQFAWLNVGNSVFSLHENPFSIASAPSAGPEISFVIKEFGDFTRTVGQIAPGTRAYVDAPYGTLAIAGRSEPGVALIAGGVGIAPLLGIFLEMRLTHDPRPVRLIYGAATAGDLVAGYELSGDDVTLVLSDPPDDWPGETGMIDAALLKRVFSQDQCDSWVFLLCGPPQMMDSVEHDLIARGVPARRILSERFDYD